MGLPSTSTNPRSSPTHRERNGMDSHDASQSNWIIHTYLRWGLEREASTCFECYAAVSYYLISTISSPPLLLPIQHPPNRHRYPIQDSSYIYVYISISLPQEREWDLLETSLPVTNHIKTSRERIPIPIPITKYHSQLPRQKVLLNWKQPPL